MWIPGRWSSTSGRRRARGSKRQRRCSSGSIEEIRRVIPPEQLQMVVNNIGLPPGGVNLAYSASDTTSNGDGDVLVLLAAKHRPTQEWMQVLRQDLAQKFPQETFFFEPADITNQTLNFGLPAPIDVQVRGKDAASTARIADNAAGADQGYSGCGGRVHAAGGQCAETEHQRGPAQGAGARRSRQGTSPTMCCCRCRAAGRLRRTSGSIRRRASNTR